MCFGTLFLFSFDRSFGLIVCNEIGVLYYSIEKMSNFGKSSSIIEPTIEVLRKRQTYPKGKDAKPRA